jgi:PPOX class probable F420-dependent enzyme
VELIEIPPDARALLEAANVVHLSTLRVDGSPRSSVVWVGLEDDNLLICMPDWTRKAKDMLRDPRVSLSVVDFDNPYRMASLKGRVLEVRPDEGCVHMNPISMKYTSRPFPSCGADRLCFLIGIEAASAQTLGFRHRPR